MAVQAVVLAGGLGTRLRPLTRKTPKSMIRFHGRPFLAYQLDLLKANGVTDVVICIGHLGDQIQRHFGDGSRLGLSLRYSSDGQALLGTGGALKNAEPLLAEEFFVLYGDAYVPVSFRAVADYCHERKGLAVMVVYRNEDRYDRSNVVLDGDKVKYYSKLTRQVGMEYIDYGLSFFRKEALKHLPAGEIFDLGVLFGALIDQGQLLAYVAEQRFYEIGSVAGIKDFEEYSRGLARGLV